MPSYVERYPNVPDELIVVVWAGRPDQPANCCEARAIIDTGSTGSFIQTAFAIRDLSLTEAGKTQIEQPNPDSAGIRISFRPGFHVVVSLKCSDDDAYHMTSFPEDAEIRRELIVASFDGVDSDEDIKVILGMDFLRTVEFSYKPVREGAHFFMSEPISPVGL